MIRSFLTRHLKKLTTALRETVYPEGALCRGCGKVSDGGYLCPECRRSLEYDNALESWERRDLGEAEAWSMRPHTGLARTLVLRLKHGAEARAAEELAGLLDSRPAYFPIPDPDTVVTWVPGPKGRVRERCVDHGKLLAEAVARKLGLESAQLLERQGNHRPQATLREKEREANLEKAFRPLGKITKPVLLVDDVLTTGTTARRCVRALKEAGAERILVLTATHAAR